MDTPLDMLQIKIERARDALSQETRKAIDSVDWRAYILGMREKKGYSFEQLEDLELETELLLCGLLNSENYPMELEERMKIPKSQVDLLVNEMNEFVFKKIKDELIKNSERREIFTKKIDTAVPSAVVDKNDSNILSKAGIEIKESPMPLQQEELAPEKEKIAPIKTKEEMPISSDILCSGVVNKIADKKEELMPFQKLSGSFQIPTVKTEYTLNSLSKQGNLVTGNSTPLNDKIKTSKSDPYRIDPNE